MKKHPTTKLEPHPYALLLPVLTEAEYAALKADIEAHGILVPVIVDAEGLVLDGVHRTRIAEELGIDVPVSQMGQVSEERKMHLAVGLNMRRRHLDADRRRDLVRRLADEQGFSVRKIASITGWSKSTVDRDLKTSPFEELIASVHASSTELRRVTEETDGAGQEIVDGVADVLGIFGGLFGWADGQWKRGNWPPPLVEHVELSVSLYALASTLRGFAAVVGAKDNEDRDRASAEFDREQKQLDDLSRRWQAMSSEERERKAEPLKERGGLWDPVAVPDGTLREPLAP